MNKFAFFAFNNNMMCFQHILLNALDLADKGKEAKIIIEGEALTFSPPVRNAHKRGFLKGTFTETIFCIMQ